MSCKSRHLNLPSEVVFTANHLTDTDKQNSTGKYTNEVQLKKANDAKHSKTKLPWFSESRITWPGNKVGVFYNDQYSSAADITAQLNITDPVQYSYSNIH